MPGPPVIREAFDYGPWAYNVDKLRQILAEHPREQVLLFLAIVRRLVRIDIEHTTTKDLDEPLLVIPYPVQQGRFPKLLSTCYAVDEHEPLMVVDGWHRVAKGLYVGRITLPAYVFTADEVRGTRFLIPGRHEIPEDMRSGT